MPIPLGFGRPLVVVPLLVSVALGHPPVVRPPFDVRYRGDGRRADGRSVTLDVPFVLHSQEQETSGSGGRVLTKSWLAVFPVVFEPGIFELQATVQTAAGSLDSTPLTIEADYSEAPVVTSLATSVQTDLLTTFRGAGPRLFRGHNLFRGREHEAFWLLGG